MANYGADVTWGCYFDFEAPDDLTVVELKERAEEIAVKKVMAGEGEMYAEDVWKNE